MSFGIGGGGGAGVTLSKTTGSVTPSGPPLEVTHAAIPFGDVKYDTRTYYDPGNVDTFGILPSVATVTEDNLNLEGADYVQDAGALGHFTTAPNLTAGLVQAGVWLEDGGGSYYGVCEVTGDGTAPSSVRVQYNWTPSIVNPIIRGTSGTGITYLYDSSLGTYIVATNVWYFSTCEWTGYSDSYVGLASVFAYLDYYVGTCRLAFSWDGVSWYYHNATSWVTLDPTDRTEWEGGKGCYVTPTSGYTAVRYSDDSGDITDVQWAALSALRSPGDSLRIWTAFKATGLYGISLTGMQVGVDVGARLRTLSTTSPRTGYTEYYGLQTSRWDTTSTEGAPQSSLPSPLVDATVVVEIRTT